MEGERARGHPQSVAFAAHLLDGDHESVFSQSAERLQRHGFRRVPAESLGRRAESARQA